MKLLWLKSQSLKPSRQKLPADLPREEVLHDLTDEEKICECCGGELHKKGESRSEKLEFIPAKIKVIEHTAKPNYHQ